MKTIFADLTEMLQERKTEMDDKKKKKRRSKTVIKPPKKNKPAQNLSKDEVRSKNKKRMHRKRKLQRYVLAFFASIAVLCVGFVLVFSLFFKINTVSVIGETIYTDKMVAQKSGIEYGSNLFRVDEEKVSAEISKKLPYIKKVSIKRKLPDEIIIEVTPSKEIAAISHNGTFVFIDGDGKVLDDNASILKESLPVINNAKVKTAKDGSKIKLTNDKKTDALYELLKAIEETEIELLTEIDLNNINDIKLKYDNRITLKLGSLTDVETKLLRGKAAIKNENEINAYSIGVLDLRKDYVYFKAGEETTAPPPTTAPENTEENTENQTN